jgi:hypothetical protein
VQQLPCSAWTITSLVISAWLYASRAGEGCPGDSSAPSVADLSPASYSIPASDQPASQPPLVSVPLEICLQ